MRDRLPVHNLKISLAEVMRPPFKTCTIIDVMFIVGMVSQQCSTKVQYVKSLHHCGVLEYYKCTIKRAKELLLIEAAC